MRHSLFGSSDYILLLTKVVTELADIFDLYYCFDDFFDDFRRSIIYNMNNTCSHRKSIKPPQHAVMRGFAVRRHRRIIDDYDYN